MPKIFVLFKGKIKNKTNQLLAVKSDSITLTGKERLRATNRV
jgi:hypothetical protein